MEKTTLMLPNGYGRGTIVYDLENKPFEAIEHITACIYEVVEVEKEYAKARIDQGAEKLISS